MEGQGWGPLRTTAAKLFLKLAPQPAQSEDCLYLNVRTPAPGGDASLPVMVWIHGGDHWYGSAGDVYYESDALAERGAVVVYINYRLGLMGYFMHPELSRESDHGASGNYGTLDQIAALAWVRDNIPAFGGDPGNVTIFGESAGGESVAHMLTSPLARGLFHKAILQSPANTGQMTFLRRPFLNNPAGEETGVAFADALVPGERDRVAALRRIPVSRLYRALEQERTFRRFYPVIDEYVLPTSPFEAFLAGDQAGVPLLLGCNADEGTVMYPLCRAPLRECIADDLQPNDMAERMRREFAGDHQAVLDLYPGLGEGTGSAQATLLGDSLFDAPVHFYARQAAKAGQPVYLYRFVRTPPSPRQTAGAFHAAELAFVHGSRVPLFETTPADAELTRVMGDYWARFAAVGDPNLAPHPEWPLFSLDDPALMQLGTGGELGPREIADRPRYEILERRLRRQIRAMEQLSSPERVAAPV
ncbi:MAG: carboxylesterase/lipase family protein [Thermoleophilia bacterium]